MEAKYKDNAPKIFKYIKDNNLKLIIHSPYVLNFAKEIDYNSINFQMLKSELNVAHMIGSIGCVIHVGKRLNLSIRLATGNMLLSLKHIAAFIKNNNLKSKLILETGAGQGSEMFLTENNSMAGYASFYHMLTEDEKKYIKICIDTCHIFAAGMDIRSISRCNELFRQLKFMDLLQHIIVIHFNDSAKDYNTHVDRHATIGVGYIGFTGLTQVLKLAYKNNIPCILETPNNSYIDEIPWITKVVAKYSNK